MELIGAFELRLDDDFKKCHALDLTVEVLEREGDLNAPLAAGKIIDYGADYVVIAGHQWSRGGKYAFYHPGSL
ncbi:MAG: hypothetical protein ACOY3F_08795 [Bacillota bacterium]